MDLDASAKLWPGTAAGGGVPQGPEPGETISTPLAADTVMDEEKFYREYRG